MSSPLLINNFEIKKLNITLNNGVVKAVDNKSVMSLEYSEGMLQKYITVTLKIADTTNGLSSALFGLEMVELVFEDLINKIKYEFTKSSGNGPLLINEIHDRQYNDTTKTFVLELAKEEVINNAVTRIGRKLSAKSAEQLINEMLAEIKPKKPSAPNISNSLNKITFIPPQAKPYEVLVWARNKFIGKDQKSGGGYASAGYFFFEDYYKYNFASFDSFSAKRKEKFHFTSGVGLKGTDELKRLVSPKHLTNFNLLKNFDKGFFSGEVFFFDLVNMTYDVASYNLSDNYSKWKKLGEDDDLPRLYKDKLSKMKPTRTMAVSYNDELFLESGEDKTDNKMYFKETIAQSVQRFGIFTSQMFTDTIAGNLGLNAGDMVIVDFHDATGNVDPSLSGRYIILGVTHIFNRYMPENPFRTNVTFVRDSFGA